MEDRKKRRSAKASTVTRRIRELRNVLSIGADKLEVTDKVNNLKYAMDELGIIQDEYVVLVEAEDNTKVKEADKWYDEYDKKAARVIQEAREYQSQLLDAKRDWHIKLQQLEITKFNSEPKKNYKWKSISERLTQQCNDELKYDYLQKEKLTVM